MGFVGWAATVDSYILYIWSHLCPFCSLLLSQLPANVCADDDPGPWVPVTRVGNMGSWLITGLVLIAGI